MYSDSAIIVIQKFFSVTREAIKFASEGDVMID
jgi:hypothetical protein